MDGQLCWDNKKTPRPSDGRCSFFFPRQAGGVVTAGRIIRCAWIYNLEYKIRENKWTARLVSARLYVKLMSVFVTCRLRRCALVCDFQKCGIIHFRLRFPHLMELQSFFSPLTMERKAPFADCEGKVLNYSRSVLGNVYFLTGFMWKYSPTTRK